MKAGENFYAAGDIARFPLNMLHDESARIEHWGMAQYQGMVAALNMVGKHKTATAVPFFWTTVFGKSVRYAGHALRYDEVLIDKEENGFEPATIKFAAFYAQKDTIVAVVTLARDPIASQAAELINAGKFPTASAVKAAIAAGKIDELIKSSL
jgi:NADPH-dependent 2,4-dienoyl-CoA reductase/sulfur reductase-like enzyme